ncbi:hypothetical protein ACLOJK_017222 [Asimina triloba]
MVPFHGFDGRLILIKIAENLMKKVQAGWSTNQDCPLNVEKVGGVKKAFLSDTHVEHGNNDTHLLHSYHQQKGWRLNEVR